MTAERVEEEKLTTIGIRCELCVKRVLQDVARDRGETLSDLVWRLINAGWETVVEQDR